MPAEKGVGLDDEEGLLPEGRRSGEEKQPEAISVAELGAFDLALQDDQLLPQEGVLGDKLGLAAKGILNDPYEKGSGVGFEAALDVVAELVRNAAEDLRSKTMDDIEHALIAP